MEIQDTVDLEVQFGLQPSLEVPAKDFYFKDKKDKYSNE